MRERNCRLSLKTYVSEGLSIHPGRLPFAAVATAPRIPFPRNALVSYHYWRSRDISALADFTLIADSGAFSADAYNAALGEVQKATKG